MVVLYIDDHGIQARLQDLGDYGLNVLSIRRSQRGQIYAPTPLKALGQFILAVKNEISRIFLYALKIILSQPFRNQLQGNK